MIHTYNPLGYHCRWHACTGHPQSSAFFVISPLEPQISDSNPQSALKLAGVDELTLSYVSIDIREWLNLHGNMKSSVKPRAVWGSRPGGDSRSRSLSFPRYWTLGSRATVQDSTRSCPIALFSLYKKNKNKREPS